jgi:hypothetical protein
MFKPKTVDAAIAPLLKAASDLEGVYTLCFDKIEANKSMIARLETENSAALKEQSRATSVLVALRGITNPKKD